MSYVAERLAEAGIGYLLLDPLTEEEQKRYASSSDVEWRTVRLLSVTRWLSEDPRTKGLRYGLFASGLEAAAALRAAAALAEEQVGDLIRGIVAYQGRPDSARGYLSVVSSPTLLIARRDEPEVLRLNEAILNNLGGVSRLVSLSEPDNEHQRTRGADVTARIAELTVDWFRSHL